MELEGGFIRMKYELTKELESGNAMIDNEHRELFRAVNELLDACGQGKGRAALMPTVNFLLNYVNKHFDHEEQLQKKCGYPNLPAHHVFHENYKGKLKEIVSQIPAAGPTVQDLSKLNMHIGVLVSHIRTEDKKLGAFLQKK